MKQRLRTPGEGADTAIWLAAGPAQESGQLWFDRMARWTHLVPWTRETARERDALWALLSQVERES